jgi:hypothetical protein
MHAVPASKTALKAILAARGAWAAVDVRDDPPTEGEDITRAMFWFEPTEIPEDAWMAGGSMRGLRFLLGFSVEILREGDDGRTTEDSLWTLVEDLVTALKSNPTLSGAIRNVGNVTGRQVNDPLPNQVAGGVHRLYRVPVELLLASGVKEQKWPY